MKRANIQNIFFATALGALLALTGCGGAGSDGATESSLSSGIPMVVDSTAAMAVGDIMLVQLREQDLVIDFAGVDEDAEFMMATGTSTVGIPTSFLMSNDLLLDAVDTLSDVSAESGIGLGGADVAPSDEYGAQEILSAWLRASERELAVQAKPVPSCSASKGASSAKAVSEGARDSFRVLASLSSTSQYATVSATARCVTGNVAIFVDDRVDGDALPQDDVDDLCAEFDDVAAWEFEALGEASDVNGDGLVTVLISPQVNMLGALAGGIIGGYFYAADLYARDGVNVTSNEQEIVYALAPDPEGEYGAQISPEYYRSEMISSVLPHELQHAINFNQHVFVRGGEAEESWLNEGLSHLVEDLAGYGNSNPGRYALFLSSPSIVSLVTDASPGLAQRGAAYLFLRYLYEQAPDGMAFVRGMIQSEIAGIDNIERAFAGMDAGFDEFGEFMARWSAALMLTSEGLGSGSPYAYEPRIADAETGNWKGVELTGEADDGRGTMLSGIFASQYTGYANESVSGTAAKYFAIADVPERIGIQSNGASAFAVLVRTR